MGRAFDIANYTPVADLTPARLQCLRDQGYTHAFVGTSFGLIWRDQIAILEAFGFVVGEYMFPGHVHDTTRPWWIDVERSPGTAVNEGTVRATIQQATHKPRGPYSNRTAWLDCIGWDWDIKREFPWMTCWDANYGWSFPRPWNAWGGFSLADRAIVQWSSGGLCGVNADLNVFTIIGQAPQRKRKDDEMQPQLVFSTDENRVYLIGTATPKIWITSQAEVDQLTKVYGAAVALSSATINQMTTKA